jgi:hypothetical protein
MIEFRRCYVEHIQSIVAQDVQTGEQLGLLTAMAAETLEQSVALSVWSEGRCIAAGGLIDAWSGRAITWAFLSKYAYQHMLPITRQIRMVLDSYPARRVETVVLRDFAPGHRWVKMLGFECETPDGMKGYFPNGDDAVLYARVKRGSGI